MDYSPIDHGLSMVRCYEQIKLLISKKDVSGVGKKVLVVWLVGLLVSYLVS